MNIGLMKVGVGISLALTLVLGGSALAQSTNRVPPAPPQRPGSNASPTPDQKENLLDRREDRLDARTSRGVLDRREDAADRREDLRDRLNNNDDRLNTAKSSFLKTRKPKTESETAEALAKAKEFALALVAKVETHLGELKNRISESNMIEARQEKLLGELGAALAKLAELKTSIESAATIAEVREIIKDIQKKVNDARFLYKRHLGLMKTHQLRQGVEHIATALNRAERAIAALGERGADTTQVIATLASLKSRLASLRASAQNTESAYQTLAEDENYEAANESAENVTSRIGTELKQILNSVKNLIAAIKALAEQVEPEADSNDL